MLQPPSIHALQKLQMENLQKLQDLDNNFLPHLKKPDTEDFPSDINEKYPEKIPEILQKIPPEILAKNPEFLKFFNINIGKCLDSANDSNSADSDITPIDLSNDKTDLKTGNANFDYEDKSVLDNNGGEEIWCRYLKPFSATEICIDGASCEDASKDHFHCIADGCNVIFRWVPFTR